MTHKITVGVHDKRLGAGEQTIPLVGPGNPSSKMKKFLDRKTKIPKPVLNRAIRNEITRRKLKSPPMPRRKPK